MPNAFGYGRVSHREQMDEDSLPAQLARCEGYYNLYLKDRDIAWGGCEYDAFAISAFNTPFTRRPAGKRLLDLVKKGDHLIIDKVDRIWRRSDDLWDQIRLFKDRGVTLHFVKFGGMSVDLGTSTGNLFVTMLVAFAQFEAEQTSQRTKDVFEFRRLQGRFPGSVPWGFRIAGKKTKHSDTRRLVPHEEKFSFMRRIYDLRMTKPKPVTWAAIGEMFEREYRDAHNEEYSKYEWNWKRLHLHRTLQFYFRRYLMLVFWEEETGLPYNANCHKDSDGLVKPAKIYQQEGEAACRAEIRRLHASYGKRSAGYQKRDWEKDQPE